jgi:hypothetical protein
MPLWIDNTGFQSAGLALEGRARGAVDVEGLLNLCVLLVFGDKILVNSFEPPSVAKRTTEVRDRLVYSGVPSTALEVVPCTPEEYWTACDTAARDCAEQLRWSFDSSEGNALGTQPDMSREELDAQFRFLDLASGKSLLPSVETIQQEGETRKAAVAIHYMLARAPELREVVKGLVSNWDQWRDLARINRLDTHIRFYLNTALAKRAGSLYTPAIARARTIRQRRRLLLEHLVSELDASLAPLTGGTLGFPAVVGTLLSRSKGDPAGLVEVALALRVDAEPLRKWLAELSARGGVDNPDAFIDSIREIRQLVADTLVQLGLGPAANGIDVSITWGMPTVNVSSGDIRSRLRRFRHRSQIAILTEVAKQALFENITAIYFERLKAQCGL